ncbi:Arginine decarboxylase [Halomicronema hongdechloris C2206]|uniref:Arginine decarboxylase n=1 Tax=Halomicronema hongdechloris C2206 TaxID=1641165 RepID=A0A1Z3HKR1_9CYAN|nr:aminotransferase class I/II-fold pyridoxal phosphate-dependent enzyme [Halomicronema hongdechloris]ASC70883.1 Arginine decarboxylase [Halomicronema hongdechloris C2206]
MARGLQQTDTPLLTALAEQAGRAHARFYAPGHKGGQGIPTALKTLLGPAVFRADLPELPELDNLFAPEGVIAAAQTLAAEAFGAERSWFLANGSTGGIEAAVLAACGPGDLILVPRNAHRSVISALILSGARPVWVQPDYDADWDLVHGVLPQTIQRGLQQFPETRAVLLTSPTYHGVCSPVAAIAEVVHGRGLPLLVDEAHGAHFAFHPALPPSALAAGADVVVQSTHKVLSAMTQASMLHGQGNRIDWRRLQQALALTQSTSPNYVLLASLDAARQQMALQGQQYLQQTLALAERVRGQIAALPGLRPLQTTDLPRIGAWTLDTTRLTVEVAGLGLSGFEADMYLHRELGVTAELPTLRHLTFILSLGNTEAEGTRLVQAFGTLAASSGAAAPMPTGTLTMSEPVSVPPYSPRQAFFAPNQACPIEAAQGHLSAECVCPYPPGIPTLLPGEMISRDAIATLQVIHRSGGIITGCSDPSLTTLRVIHP